MQIGRLSGILALVFILGCASETSRVAQQPLPAPLFTGLGNHHHRITTKSKLAQNFFDQGMILLYGFNHAEAIRSFDAVAKLDPDCAMAHWGIAYAYGPNINMPMDDNAVPKAWQALQKAIALKAKASPKEQAYIDALSKRYAENPPKPRAPLDQAYANAMREVAKQYPKDLDAQTLFAEAVMDTSPWNYWQPDGTMKPNAKEALAAIESVLSRTRQHPGADHLHIHLVEAGPNPERAEVSADRLGKFAPSAGHLVHMPSHIYVRVGRYHDASTMNELASRADESYLAQCRQQGMYPGGYYPHNVHFLWFATALEGRSRESIAAAKKVGQYTSELRCGAIEGARQRYLPLLAYARFGRWEQILKEPAPPAADFPFDLAMWHYARGVALAATGKPDDATAEHGKLRELAKSEKVIAMDNPYFPGTKILAIADEVLAGKIAAARGAADESMTRLKHAVQLEDAMPYMEPPYWYYPVRQSLAAALLKGGDGTKAEAVFREDLSKTRGNGWALFGLEKSLRAQGKIDEAERVHEDFMKVWKYADSNLDLTWF